MTQVDKYGLKLRTISLSDAPFIVELRTNQQLSKYLNPISGDVKEQENWIASYLEREKKGTEYYFVTEQDKKNQYGLTRLYNLTNTTFELGSWLFKQNLPVSIPILADLATRDFAFEILKLKICYFEVRKENKAVVKYHKAFKPTLEKEDELNYYYSLNYETYINHRNKLLKILV